MKKIAVIGAGTMGNGIAHVFALNGFEVILNDIKQEFLDKAFEVIKNNLDRQEKKGIITLDQKLSAINNIRALEGVENIPIDCDLIIEAIYENKEVKGRLFNTLGSRIKKDSIFATNTSSISITELASYSNRPDRFIGMHFMNPVPVMKLVEIIRGYSTSDETFNIVRDLATKVDKTPVEVFDYPGFVSNRILIPMINEAIYAFMEGVASKEDIDAVMKLGMTFSA
jgi:3-hydroxybutyryl-CoA dehydrogenase